MAHPAIKPNPLQKPRKVTWLNKVLEDEWMNKVIEWTVRSMLLVLLALLSRSLRWIETYRIPWFKLTVVMLAVVWVVKEKDQIEQFWNQVSGQNSEYTALFSSVQFLDHGTVYTEGKAEKLTVVDSGRTEVKEADAAPRTTPKSADLSGIGASTASGQAVHAYIDRFAQVARAEQLRFGIPASIKMAQAILESNAGRSGLAVNHNNHFGIKCMSRSCTKGHCTNHADDHHKDFFVNYQSAWQSWRAHSELLLLPRYSSLFEHDSRDYVIWAKGLQAAGYATDPAYATKLIDIIERHQLWILDLPADELM